MAPRKYKKGDRLVYPHHGACTVETVSYTHLDVYKRQTLDRATCAV